VLTWVDCRDWVHQARQGNPWVLRRPSEAIQIGPLISPLRFDVTIRASYFDFYAEHRDLFRSDFEAYAQLARSHDYYVWFTEVMCPNWQPHVLTDPTKLASAWGERLRASAALYDSFERSGFDERFPITLRAARRVEPTPTGKRLARDLYAGDGNHRMALLMATGQTALLPSQCRVKHFLRLEPSDTTPQLLAALDVDEHRYLAFLRLGYPSMADAGSDDETRHILHIDTPHLTKART
jgi:hypothetical protein